MHIVCYDFETTGRNSVWDQIIQVGAVLTNENLEEIDSYESSCLLKPGTIPEPGALMVNEQIPGEGTQLTHYSFVKLMWQKFTDWINTYGPIAFVGYNSVNFDEEFLRRTLYKNLFPPFLTTAQNFGNPGKRGDIINLARTANVFYPGTLKTTFNEKGKEVYKLGQLVRDNVSSGIATTLKFHNALDDVRGTIEIARIVKNQAPKLWVAALKTMNKKDVFEFVHNENIVLSSEFYFGTARTYIVALVCEGLKGTLKTFDLRNDPSQFIGLDYQELKRIIMGAKPKIIRSIIPNKHPILMRAEPEWIKLINGYEDIGIEELRRRANLIKDNIEFHSQLKRILLEEQEETEQDQSDKEPEECIYSYGFAGPQEKDLMIKFHSSSWQGKLEIAEQFKNLRTNDYQSSQRGQIYSEFAKLIVYEDNPESLSDDEKKRIKKKLADRIFYSDSDHVKSPWNNIGRAHIQLENLGAGLESEGKKDDSNELLMLYKIKDLIEKIENEFGEN